MPIYPQICFIGFHYFIWDVSKKETANFTQPCVTLHAIVMTSFNIQLRQCQNIKMKWRCLMILLGWSQYLYPLFISSVPVPKYYYNIFRLYFPFVCGYLLIRHSYLLLVFILPRTFCILSDFIIHNPMRT